MLRVIALALIVALTACSGGGIVAPSGSQPIAVQQQYAQLAREIPDALPGPQSGFIPFTSSNPVRARCPQTIVPHEMRCFSLVRTDIRPVPDTGGIPKGAGYAPQDLQAAYGLTSASAARGKGQTVAIVDYASYPDAVKDLAIYRKAAGLPACTTHFRCLRIVNQDGNAGPLPVSDPNWDGEQALDLDMVSAICPHCRILLVEANSSHDYDLYTSEKTAARMGAQVISNSWGGSEYAATNWGFDDPGHVHVASAGDEGAYARGYQPPPQSPCTFAEVVCVGGTKLVRARNARGWSETVWNDFSMMCSGGTSCGATGSGCSTAIAKPSYQTQKICAMRAESDVSAVAAVSTPVAVYYGADGGWEGLGGTSAAAPIVAAIFALAGNAKTVAEPAGIWKGPKTNYHDVIHGLNTDANDPCPQGDNVSICKARKGYDGPTGWGTPKGIAGF